MSDIVLICHVACQVTDVLSTLVQSHNCNTKRSPNISILICRVNIIIIIIITLIIIEVYYYYYYIVTRRYL